MSRASDVYAAGVIAYQVLTGEPPFASSTDQYQRASALPLGPMAAAGLAAAAHRPAAAGCARRHRRRAPRRPRPWRRWPPALSRRRPGAPAAACDYRNLPEGYQLTRKYTVQRKIGGGSFGVVYQVYDNLADADRAVKIVDRDRDSHGRAAPSRSTGSCSALPPHPNVVRVESADYLDGQDVPYLVFEYLDGKDVSDLVKDAGTRPRRHRPAGHRRRRPAWRSCTPTASTTATSSRATCCGPTSGCKIIDFNVAVLSSSSMSRAGGSAAYAPPDSSRAAPPSGTDLADRDVYALGVTLYQVLTGRYPFRSGAPALGEIAADPRSIAELQRAFGRPRRHAAAAPSRRCAATGTAAPRSSSPRCRRSARCTAGPLPQPPAAPAAGARRRRTSTRSSTHLQSLYSQSPVSNAGTRGDGRVRHLRADGAGRAPDPGRARRHATGLVIITGNAGDGKTAFLERLIAAAVERGGQRGARGPTGRTCGCLMAAGCAPTTTAARTRATGPTTTSCMSSSPRSPTAAGATAARDPADRDQRRAARRLPRPRTQASSPRSQPLVRRRARGQGTGWRRHRRGEPEPAQPGRRRATRATCRSSTGCSRSSPRSGSGRPAQGCELARTCYAPHNARTFAHPSAGPKVTRRLRDLYRLVHLRGQLHITLRDLRSALAFMLTSGRDCAQIHELYRTGDAARDPVELLLQQLARHRRHRRPAAAAAARA